MDIDEINAHIRKLKCEETSWQSVNQLAALCMVRNELEETRQTQAPQPVSEQKAPAYSTKSAPQSEFTKAASGVPFDGLLDVLDEHMNAIKMVYPKEYELVIRRLQTLD